MWKSTAYQLFGPERVDVSGESLRLLSKPWATEGASSLLGDTPCTAKDVEVPVWSRAFGRDPEA